MNAFLDTTVYSVELHILLFHGISNILYTLVVVCINSATEVPLAILHQQASKWH